MALLSGLLTLSALAPARSATCRTSTQGSLRSAKCAVRTHAQSPAAATPVQDVGVPYADDMQQSMTTMKLIAPHATCWQSCGGWFSAKGDKSMNWLILIILAILVLAPVRKAFFSAWRFTLPVIAGFIFAAVMLKAVIKMNLPGLAILGICLFVAVVIGVEAKQMIDETFGPRKQQ